MPRKQSSANLSALAARILNTHKDKLAANCERYPDTYASFLKKLAASVLSQDERRGK